MPQPQQNTGGWLLRCCTSWVLFVALLTIWTAALLLNVNFHGLVHGVLLLAMVQLMVRIMTYSRQE